MKRKKDLWKKKTGPDLKNPARGAETFRKLICVDEASKVIMLLRYNNPIKTPLSDKLIYLTQFLGLSTFLDLYVNVITNMK